MARLSDDLKQYFDAQKELSRALNELEQKFPLMNFKPDAGNRAGQRLAYLTEDGVTITSPLTHDEAIELAFWLSEVFGV